MMLSLKITMSVVVVACVLFTIYVATVADMSKCRYVARTMPLWCER